MRSFDEWIAIIQRQLGMTPNHTSYMILGCQLWPRYGTIKARGNYGAGWAVAMAANAKSIFDIGCNIGHFAIVTRLFPQVENILLVDANAAAL